MRLRRLALENWRGIESCEVTFGDGVTIVEGPNEAGKSTLVEALLTLIKELDSSKKQAIKAVMPVGKDVGSRVEAEIETGDYHFVYAKTYNKSPQTTLEIRAPRAEQVTGREAHERAEAILEETVDLALWEALLTEQGGSLEPAEIRNSEGLSNALDEAAGSAATGAEDMDLFAAAQAEYEKYYTLKAGRPKFADLEKQCEAAEADVNAAKTALAEVEQDAAEHANLQSDVRRRQASIPELEAKVQQHEQSWRQVEKLKSELELKEANLKAAEDKQSAAEKALKERNALAESIEKDKQNITAEKEKQEPLEDKAKELEQKVESARLVIDDKRKKRNAAREKIENIRADLDYLRDLERLAQAEKRLAEYEKITGELKQASKTVNDIVIDEQGLETLRKAVHELDVARQKRDLAATEVSVTAETPLEFNIDDSAVSLESGGKEQRTTASGLKIHFPGVATVEVAPSRTAAELDSELHDAETALEQKLKRYQVESLDDAIAKNESRRAAEADITRLRSRTAEVLGDVSAEELAELAASLRKRCDAFLEKRTNDDDLPESASKARERVSEAEQATAELEAKLEAAQETSEKLRAEHAEADAALRQAKETLIKLDTTLNDKQSRLKTSRAERPDETLAEQAREAAKSFNELRVSVDKDREKLEQFAPDTVESLFTNARDTLDRAKRELADVRQKLAVLEDRLQRAQADGRFEQLEAAERELEEAQLKLYATRSRAEAAERLWRTLNRHRNAAREAYVEPLKEAIERLGRIVFGPTFEVSIAEDWTVESLTRHGKMLPFDSHSIGTQEQVGILARLAAATIIAEQGGVPLIIDDALGFSDPSRLETMGAAIAAAGKECQVIILTCTPGRFAHVGSADVVSV